MEALLIRIAILFSCQVSVVAKSVLPESELVNIKLLSKRGADSVSHLVFSAFGKNRQLTLKPVNIFSPGFRSWSTDGSGSSVKRGEDAAHPGGFYSVVGGTGSLHVIQERDSLAVEGILDNELTIAPHAPTGLHTVTKRKIPTTGPSDYIKLNKTNINKIKNPTRPTNRQMAKPPEKVTIEILVAIDYLNSKQLSFDLNTIKKYLGIFWNSVNQRYSEVTDPSIQLFISDLVVFKSLKAQPFITNNMVDDFHATEKILPDFREWLNSQTNLVEHDIAMLQTAVDAGSVSFGQWLNTVAGLAYIGTACNTDGTGSGFVEDKAPAFTGVIVASHELAHLLNVPHDGSGDSSSCVYSDGYIMGESSFGQNNWHFSSCSKTVMTEYLRSEAGSCMWSNPTIDPAVPLVNEWPASMAGSLDEQCRIRSGDDTAQFWGAISEDVCTNLWCSKEGSNSASSSSGAVEGTPCNIGKVCLSGVCSPNGIPTLDEQCQDAFGNDYYAEDKDNPSVCSDLQCSNGGNPKSSGGAKEGSTCGNAGVCRGGECQGEIPSLDDQCKRNFGDNYFYYKRDPNPCDTLWCTENNRNLLARGPADENSVCSENGNRCQNQECVGGK